MSAMPTPDRPGAPAAPASPQPAAPHATHPGLPPEERAHAKARSHAAGMQAIIFYKLAKALFATLVGFGALSALQSGAEALSATLAQVLLDHATRAWALQAATLIVTAGTTAHVKIAAGAAFGDGLLSAVEGFALRAGHWWAPWLVVVGTSVLLPWEVLEVVRHPHWGRVLVLVVNLGVVVYLLLGVRREHRRDHPEEYGR